MVAQRHLVLLFSLIQISVEHLQDCILRVYFTIVVLLENLNFLFELLRLGEPEHFTPMRQDLHAIQMG
jgi:hypothetical protein